MNPKLVITCEHGGNRVPKQYARLFRGGRRLLESHRGYDPGALELARLFSRRFRAPLVWSTTSRLVVDLNRSPGHARLFSRFTDGLETPARQAILARYYTPYRQRVEALASEIVEGGDEVLHLSVHSFTPELDGQVRNADIGLLYDPARARERQFCERWQLALNALRPGLRVRRNYPYRGVSDGLVTYLRRRFGAQTYTGIELEVNQLWPLGEADAWRALRHDLVQAFLVAAGTPG